MKRLQQLAAIFAVIFLLIAPLCAEPKSEKMVNFAIPISDNLLKVLGDSAGSGKRAPSEMLENIGIILYPGSEVWLNKDDASICGTLAHSQASLVVEVSRMFSTATVEEILP